MRVLKQKTKHAPALRRCACGCTLELARFINECDGCGATYDSAGRSFARLPSSDELWGVECQGEYDGRAL